jgi:hypothetical protein
MIGRIYNNAKSVAVWLGPGEHDSDYIFDLVDSKTYSWERLLNSLVARCRRDYWKRAWIRQEILQSNNITFFCGERRVRLRPGLGFVPRLGLELARTWTKSLEGALLRI